MHQYLPRGEVSSQVSDWHPSSSKSTPLSNTSFAVPHGLKLQQKVGMVDITNANGNGTTITYTAVNNYSVGNIVSIYSINPTVYNLQNVTIASASSTQFTITNGNTGTYISGGVAQRTGEQAVSIPSGITFVYAILVGAGGGGNQAAFNTGRFGGGAGGVAWGWTLNNSICFIGAGSIGSSVGEYTRYGNIIAGGGGSANSGGSIGGGGNSNSGGATNYWGIPGGASVTADTALNGNNGSGGGSGANSTSSAAPGGNGGNGISGGGGGGNTGTSGTCVAGNGGNGLAGGGGGRATLSTDTRIGGNGGNGINILTGVVTTGGTGSTGTNTAGEGGGGGGIVTNGSSAIPGSSGFGGLGGGGGGAASGRGGAGILYLFY
jgi:hypothetical protein